MTADLKAKCAKVLFLPLELCVAGAEESAGELQVGWSLWMLHGAAVDEVKALTGLWVFSPVWGIPGRFGTVRDEGRLFLLVTECRHSRER